MYLTHHELQSILIVITLMLILIDGPLLLSLISALYVTSLSICSGPGAKGSEP